MDNADRVREILVEQLERVNEAVNALAIIPQDAQPMILDLVDRIDKRDMIALSQPLKFDISFSEDKQQVAEILSDFKSMKAICDMHPATPEQSSTKDQ